MRTFIYTSIALTIAACSSTPESDLQTLIEKRDSLKAAYKETASLLAQTEDQIIALDPSLGAQVKNVTTQKIKAKRFEHFFMAQGVVETNGNASLSAETPGRITSVKVKTGDRVVKGTVLAVIDGEIIAQNKKELENALSLAKDVFSRQEKLWKQNIGSEIEYITAKNNVESLELKIKTLDSQASKSYIRAPFSGVVDQVNVKLGQLASPGFPLIRMVSLNGAYIKAELSENHLKSVQKGQKVQIEFPSLDLKKTSSISRVGSFIDPNNRTFLVEVDLRDNLGGKLRPNLLGYVWINDFALDSAIVIPSSVIQQDAEGNSFVYVTKASESGILRAEKRTIEIGQTSNGNQLVIAGLNSSDELILQGSRLIADNEKINIVEAQIAAQ